LKLSGIPVNPFDQQSHNTVPATIVHRLDAMEHRIARVERILEGLSMPTMADAARYRFADGDVGGVLAAMPPWVSNSVRLVGNLSSSDFGRQTRNDALLGGGVFTCLGGIATLLGSLPAYAPLVVGCAGFALTGAVLVVHNRTMLHMLIRQQEKKNKKGELRVQINQPEIDHVDFLFLNGEIDREDLRTMAERTLAGKSLAVHSWIGVGGWTRTKLDNFYAECEKMRYMRPGRGNKPRELTPQGRALFKALAE
jgi:hypothetical protein